MSKPLRLLLSGFWLSFAVVVILAALLLSAVRLALPAMGQHRDEVAAWVSDLVGQPVRIGVAATAVCPAANSTVPAGTIGRTASRRGTIMSSLWKPQ